MTSHPSCISSAKMVVIIVWNMAREFVDPKNIIVGLNNPSLVTKAAFHLLPALIRMLL